MDQSRETSDGTEAKPQACPTDRREFLRKTLHAGPIVLTAVHDGSFQGPSVRGTLWSSGGTDWTHPRRWWHGPGGGRWEDPRPRTRVEPPVRERHRPAETEWEWRHWRPETGENERPEWDWDYLRPRDATPEDAPADPPETTRPPE